MKALTICQPYAHLIMLGEKRVENRTWSTNYRGLLYIHAGKSREWLEEDDLKVYPGMPFGAIVAIAKLIDCINYDDVGKGIHSKKYPWLAGHEHASGPWCWILDEVTPIGPWPWKGAQGLFSVDERELDRVANRVLGVQQR